MGQNDLMRRGAPSPVPGRPRARTRRRASGTSLGLAGLLGVVALTGCGGDGTGTANADAATTIAATLPLTDESSATVAPTEAPTTSTLAPSTTARATTTSTTSTTTTVTSTTLAPTTVVTLPVPAAPPPPRAEEAYVELGTIEIPKIGVGKTLLEGISLNTLDLGPGHWPGTAMPGQLGNAVIAGHRTSHDKPFRNIDQLVPGDEVIFTTADGRFVYLVTGTTIVAPDAMYIIDQTLDATATLFACHPPGSTKQRIVVSLALVA